MHRRSSALLFLLFSLFGYCKAQSDLQKQIQAALAIKKREGAKNNGKDKLPAGYDNSWKVNITLTRTILSSADMTETSGGCRETRKSSGTFTVQSNLSSDQTIGNLNGDDFGISTAVDDNFKRFMRPFTGGYSVSSQAHGTVSACNHGSETEYSGISNMNPSTVDFSFSYNKKSKQGSFMIALPENYQINANGKMSSWSDGNPKTTADVSEVAKAQIGLTFAACGLFQSWNYRVAKDASVQQALSASPVNGGMASIGETRYGYEINYSESKTIKGDIPDGFAGANETIYTTSVHVFITDRDPVQYDAIVEAVGLAPGQPADYDNWIPQGPPISGRDPAMQAGRGNSIGFRVYVVDRKKPDQELPGMEYDADFVLPVVSVEPGYCLNYPKEATDKGKPDLIFDSIMMRKGNISYSPKEVRSTGNTGNNLFVYLTSYDYGSFAKMKVTVTLKYGSILEAHLKNDKRPLIMIPKDDNDNQIADAWEKEAEINIYSKHYSPFRDEEKQKLKGLTVNDHNGDGLTLYEEYRGMAVKGQHERLDPNVKKLFVVNQIGDKAKPGMDLFSGATGISVIELSDQDIDKYDLVLNRNSVFARGGRQHALLLQYYNEADSSVQGYTPNREGNGKTPPTSPGDCAQVGISQNYPFKGHRDLDVAIAHEMAHGCGVWHHGELESQAPPDKNTLGDTSYKFLTTNNLHADKASIAGFKKTGLLGLIAGPGGQSSGDMRCIMCYEDSYVWAEPPGTNGRVFISVDHQDEYPKTLFCNSKTGTILNAPGRKLYPVYGDAGRGDCIHQFQVKDW